MNEKAPRKMPCPECGTAMRRRPGIENSSMYGCRRCGVITYWAGSKSQVRKIMKHLKDVKWTKDKPKGFDLVKPLASK